jgi:hypothetical protein
VKRWAGIVGRLFAAVLTVVVSASCSSPIAVTGEVGYKPPFLPVALTVDSRGHISVEGDASIVTPVGTFSIGANVTNAMKSVPHATLLIIRHKRDGLIVDTVFTVRSQEIVAVVNGRVTLTVTNGRIFVDASKGHVLSIKIHSSVPRRPAHHNVAKALSFTDPLTSSSHAKGWPTYYYPPSGHICGFEQNGFYLGTGYANGYQQRCDNQRINVGNADVSVTATLIADHTAARLADSLGDPENGYGMNVRVVFDQVNNSSIGFSILPDGRWEDYNFYGIFQVHPVNAAIHKGLNSSNELEIKSIGHSFRYFVNGVQIGSQVAPWVPATGGIGFYVDDYDTAVYRNLVVKSS